MQRDEPKSGFLGSTYTALRRIDRGIGAEVWKALRNGPAGFAKLLALKKVPPEIAADTVFVKEMSVVAHLVHPNVVQVLDFEQLESECFLAMEYVPGSDLAHLLAGLRESGEELEVHEAIYLVLEIVRGLRALHERAPDPDSVVLHRGLAPENVLLSWQADVKLTDFCMARPLDPDDAKLRDRLAWMSPEQAGAAPIDERSDLFSAALILYDLVTGRRLFAEDSIDALVWRIVSFEGLAPDELDRVPLDLWALLTRALQPRLDDRFANAREMEAALVPFLSPADAARARASLAMRLSAFLEGERPDVTRETDRDTGTALSPLFPEDRVEEPTARLPDADEPPAPPAIPAPPPAAARHSRRAELLVVLLLSSVGLFASSERAASTSASASPSPSPVIASAAPAESGMASLSVTSRKWVEVWVDGKRIGKGTPVRSLPVKAGRHVLRVMNPEIGLILETTVWLAENGEREYVVDPAAGGLREVAK